MAGPGKDGAMANTKRIRPAAGKAPGSTVHRLKTTLRGSQSPIWRRLEVPSDSTLEQLHQIIQTAFGWEDYHMWVFQTPGGDYGLADRELGHRDAASQRLGKAAPRPAPGSATPTTSATSKAAGSNWVALSKPSHSSRSACSS